MTLFETNEFLKRACACWTLQRRKLLNLEAHLTSAVVLSSQTGLAFDQWRVFVIFPEQLRPYRLRVVLLKPLELLLQKHVSVLEILVLNLLDDGVPYMSLELMHSIVFELLVELKPQLGFEVFHLLELERIAVAARRLAARVRESCCLLRVRRSSNL